MRKFEPKLLPLHVGSVPHTDPLQACRLTFKYFPQIPTWPQLPRRTFLENMYVQFSERFPGVVLEDGRIYVDRTQDLDPGLEQLYVAYLENQLDFAAISADYAAGFSRFIQEASVLSHPLVAVKGQVTGPISWGLMVVDQDRRPVLYEEVLADAVAKHLRLKAAWQERELRKVCPNVIMFVDEPYMASFGSAFVSLGREQTIALIEEVLAGIKGIKGVHCCGNTDWSLLLETSIDILNLDAYEYAEALSLYPTEVRAFLERGGIIAWGITPNSDKVMDETVESLVDKLHGAMNLLVRKGIPFEDILAASLITPACGTGSLTTEMAERVFELTAGVSAAMRRRYGA
ncbi:MAG: methionine synthase [Anaerolineae bacterium]|nr:methionine synthase [Anaerolineae bacterium]MDH7474165.1 methionine synthase [Anaerolineae bacterium]